LKNTAHSGYFLAVITQVVQKRLSHNFWLYGMVFGVGQPIKRRHFVAVVVKGPKSGLLS